MEQELKVLLYRCYMLAFEAGYSSGSVYSAEDSWAHNKYLFEYDIKRFNQENQKQITGNGAENRRSARHQDRSHGLGVGVTVNRVTCQFK